MTSAAALHVGRRAFDWIVRHADRFRDAPDVSEPTRIKRLAELAMLAGPLSGVVPDARPLLALAWDALDHGAAIARLLEARPAVVTAYLPFLRAGLRSPALDKRLVAADWRVGHARWPLFTRLAVGEALAAAGIATPWDQSAVLVAQGLFDRPTPSSSLFQALCLAHVVMWRTATGSRPAGLGPRTTAGFRELGPLWLAWLEAAALFDPLAEMLLANRCAGGADRPAALACLARVQRADGSMPSHAQDRATDFDGAYHATLVTALCGLRLAHRDVVAPQAWRPTGWMEVSASDASPLY